MCWNSYHPHRPDEVVILAIYLDGIWQTLRLLVFLGDGIGLRQHMIPQGFRRHTYWKDVQLMVRIINGTQHVQLGPTAVTGDVVGPLDRSIKFKRGRAFYEVHYSIFTAIDSE